MSRKLFKSHSHRKHEKSAISITAERDFERELKKIEQLEECTRKLSKDMKRCSESMQGQSKCEVRVLQDLYSSSLCQNDEQLRRMLEPWLQAVRRLDTNTQDMTACANKTVTEPLKRFSIIFPSVMNAVKKREQCLQEYTKCQAKLDKHMEKERTGANMVKLHASKKSMAAAKEEFEASNAVLMEDLPALYDGRLQYFEPCLLALIRAQVKFYTDAVKVYSDLCMSIASADEECSKDEDDDAFDERSLQQKLLDIKALSIVVDD